MDLFILRHGKAAPAGPDGGDAGRQLTDKGREEIEGMARWMASRGFEFDIIATSPLARAKETADIVAGKTGPGSRLESWASLSTAGSNDRVCSEIARHAEKSAILLVGHEPSLSQLIGWIITGSRNADIVLAKGGLAKIRNIVITGDRVRGELQWLLTPKQVLRMR